MISAITFVLCVGYAVFLIWCYYHWNKLSVENIQLNASDEITVAVIIPVRNESSNIIDLLDALSKQNYSPFEIIVADDHSTDSTVALTEKWILNHPYVKIKCIRSDGKSKKDAIAFAIKNTNAELILTTDADCRMSESWIRTIVHHYTSTGSFLISSPVIMKSNNSLAGKIQSVEYSGLIAIGAAAIQAGMPMYCSGANLAFAKNKFLEIGGYSGSKSTSGDDTQLMKKIHEKWPGKISFLKDLHASVETSTSEATLLFEQRRRWASKIPTTLSFFTVSIAALAWIVHLFLLIQLIQFFSGGEVKILVLSWMIKVSAELLLLFPVTRFMKQKLPVFLIILIQPIYAIYIVIVGAIAPFTNFSWKGRSSR